jgi:hypothetical protein
VVDERSHDPLPVLLISMTVITADLTTTVLTFTYTGLVADATSRSVASAGIDGGDAVRGVRGRVLSC